MEFELKSVRQDRYGILRLKVILFGFYIPIGCFRWHQTKVKTLFSKLNFFLWSRSLLNNKFTSIFVLFIASLNHLIVCFHFVQQEGDIFLSVLPIFFQGSITDLKGYIDIKNGQAIRAWTPPEKRLSLFCSIFYLLLCYQTFEIFGKNPTKTDVACPKSNLFWA